MVLDILKEPELRERQGVSTLSLTLSIVQEDHAGPHSVAGLGLLSNPELGTFEDEIAYFCGSFVGSQTGVAISTILVATAHFPEIQEIFQAEIDSVAFLTVRRRMLSKYLHCLVLLPWNKDVDEYSNGYWTPANAIVSGNHWCISRDPDVFPEKFDIS
ncbi:hypothetical protein BU15DRAFT_68984 [Melanogaster broomeanus]|nr:hypothetical protein BU15DRAFT_68984 [Melanogaster broomeanus]